MEDLFPLESTWMLAVASAILAFFMIRRLAHALPIQNILLIVVFLMGGEAATEWLVIKAGRLDMPDPEWRYLAGAGLLWMAVALTARRLAKLVARPWRKEKVHWLWVIFLSGVGVAAFQFDWPLLDPDFFMRKRLAAMVGVRAGCTMVLLAVLAPWFIRKRPRRGKDFSELPDQPEDDGDEDAEEQASNDRKVKTGVAPVNMDVPRQPAEPPQPAASGAGPDQQSGGHERQPGHD
jgi:hypothetical protein